MTEEPREARADGISKDEIHERAYDLWERHHRPDGFELEFWFMAERELRFERMEKEHGRVHAPGEAMSALGPDVPSLPESSPEFEADGGDRLVR